MKPRYGDVSELDPAFDFSHAGLEDALEEIPRKPDDYCTVTLSANTGDLIKAIDLCRLYKLELGLSTTYERDEWSLTCISLSPPKTSICWSPGA